MITVRLLGLLAAIFLASSAHAVSLYTWKPDPRLPAYVLPVATGETPAAAARRYLNGLHDPELAREFPQGLPDFALTGFSRLGETASHPRALLLANMSWDYDPSAKRLGNFIDPLTHDGVEALVLPIAADLGLSDEEAADVPKLLARAFPFAIAMGGPDVDPTNYGASNEGALRPNPRRDRFEIAVLRAVRAQGGFIFGICHGAQITSVALRSEEAPYTLTQDIPTMVPNALHHEGGVSHLIRVLPTTRGFLSGALRASGAVSPEGLLRVNSYHHQYVNFVSGGPLELAALAPDGITEALESSDGRVVLLQFHPEIMARSLDPAERAVGVRIMSAAVERFHELQPSKGWKSFSKRESRARSCRALFQ